MTTTTASISQPKEHALMFGLQVEPWDRYRLVRHNTGQATMYLTVGIRREDFRGDLSAYERHSG